MNVVFPLLFAMILQVSYCLLELLPAVLVVLEKVETCAAGAQQHHVSALGEAAGRLDGLVGRHVVDFSHKSPFVTRR